jgi:hypothetical protein
MTTNERVMDLLKLVTELWPKWRVTKGIADLFVDEFSDIDPDCAEQAIRKHRLERSTIPDLKAMVEGARAMERAQEKRAAESVAEQASTFDEQAWRGRLRVWRDEADEKQWTHSWRYCREFAYHAPKIPFQRKAMWPPHWNTPAVEPDEWPVEVVWAFSQCAEKMGWWSPHERRRKS